jgi:hypothetical protein
MIRYSLICEAEHEFEAWFRNSADFDKQAKKGQVECPVCGDRDVKKAIVAPAVARTDNARSGKPSPQERQQFFAAVRKHVEDNFEDVGDRFPDEARRMHEGEIEDRPIYGEATPEEAQELIEEGVAIAPLPAPLQPKRRKRLN